MAQQIALCVHREMLHETAQASRESPKRRKTEDAVKEQQDDARPFVAHCTSHLILHEQGAFGIGPTGVGYCYGYYGYVG